MRTIRYQ